jgi:thiol-disulfide isomerase/thioredoxin
MPLENSPPPAENPPPAPGKARRWGKWLLELLVFAALFFGLRAYMSYGAASGLAPPLAGALLDGQDIRLEDYRGQPVLVHFWATWCPVCKLMQDSVASLAEDHPVLSVAMQSGEAAEISAYLRERGVSLPVLPDPAGILSSRYGVRGVPASFVIDGEGQVRFVEIGYTSELGLRFRLYWAGLTK